MEENGAGRQKWFVLASCSKWKSWARCCCAVFVNVLRTVWKFWLAQTQWVKYPPSVLCIYKILSGSIQIENSFCKNLEPLIKVIWMYEPNKICSPYPLLWAVQFYPPNWDLGIAQHFGICDIYSVGMCLLAISYCHINFLSGIWQRSWMFLFHILRFVEYSGLWQTSCTHYKWAYCLNDKPAELMINYIHA